MSQSPHRATLLKSLIAVLVLAAVGGAAFAVLEVRDVLAESRPETPLLFDHGLTTRQTGAPKEWTNESCAECHKQAYDQWKGSLHEMSAANSSFRREVLLPGHGRSQFCINCHAPAHDNRETFPMAEPDRLDEAFHNDAEWATKGVDCLTCHVRDGQVLGVNVTDKGQAAHPMRAAPEMASAEFCASCHQFGFKVRNFPDGFSGALQQASFEEFLDVRHRGEGADRCQDCHMQGGNHHMGGGYSREMLEQAVSVEVSAQWRSDLNAVHVQVDLVGGSAGHRIPGGEHFRFLTVQTTLTDADGIEVEGSGNVTDSDGTLARLPERKRPVVVQEWPHEERLERILDVERGQEVVDNRLWPGERRRYEYLMPADADSLPKGLTARAEVWYHVMDETKAKMVKRPLDDVRWMVTDQEARVRIDESP